MESINVAGRKKIEYTAEQHQTVEKLSSLGCTYDEISAFVDIPVRSLKRHFGINKKVGFGKFKIAIRREQFKLLQKGNATMGVWLGKQFLGQTDKSELEMNVNAVEISKEFAKMVSTSGAGSAT